jgi:hypothetical protein
MGQAGASLTITDRAGRTAAEWARAAGKTAAALYLERMAGYEAEMQARSRPICVLVRARVRVRASVCLCVCVHVVRLSRTWCACARVCVRACVRACVRVHVAAAMYLERMAGYEAEMQARSRLVTCVCVCVCARARARAGMEERSKRVGGTEKEGRRYGACLRAGWGRERGEAPLHVMRLFTCSR